MSSPFDEFSKALATGMPRRTALKLFGAAVVASVLTPLGRLEVVEASRRYPTGCKPGLIPITIQGQTRCVPGHCSPPCRGDQICAMMSTSGGALVPTCIPRASFH